MIFDRKASLKSYMIKNRNDFNYLFTNPSPVI